MIGLMTRRVSAAGVAIMAAETPRRRLDRKLGAIRGGRYRPDDFIIADAKDADMAFGTLAAGPRPGTVGSTDPAPSDAAPGRYRTRPDYLQAIRDLVTQGELDIVLTSAANGQLLATEGSLDPDLTLAVRANDTTDIWFVRNSGYSARPSRPFRTAELEAVRPFCDLVLYSITFNNDLDHDLASLESYRSFRREAEAVGMRHFLEVFNPNAPVGLAPEHVGAFVNDSIVRTLAGVVAEQRPLFLKMAFNGIDALAELAEHDPSLVVGILGGSAGTTRDAFELVHQAEGAGARVALFGRKIQRAESQLDLVAHLRLVLRRELTPVDAVESYHQALAAAGLEPGRPLAEDREITEAVLLAGR